MINPNKISPSSPLSVISLFCFLPTNCHLSGLKAWRREENEVIGGVLGGMVRIITNGKVMNCVALNKNLNKLGETSVFFRLRVIFSTYSPVASNNYARADMLMDGVPFSGDGDPAGEDGQSIDKGQFNSKAWWTITAEWADEGWDFANTWEWDNARKLPKLRNLGGR